MLNQLRNWGAGEIGQPSLSIDSRQLQARFKHAADFGIAGSFNKANAGAFEQAIRSFVGSSGTQTIQGTYRGTQNVTLHLNSQTRQMVMTDRTGKFMSAWKLSEEQLKNVLERGSLK